jgi:thiamine-phosphate pyrophosphorylase
MRIVVVSPPDDRPGETEICRALFEAGLARYHLRKPAWTEVATRAWCEAMPPVWRSRIVLHGHHGLARLGMAGVHFRDDGRAPADPPASVRFSSRSCHDARTVSAALGRYAAVLVGPLFASRSKPGYGPMPEPQRADLHQLLRERTATQRQTEVIAIGGVDTDALAACAALGCDGAAVLGAVWDAPDPVAAFLELRAAAVPSASNHPSESRSCP